MSQKFTTKKFEKKVQNFKKKIIVLWSMCVGLFVKGIHVI